METEERFIIEDTVHQKDLEHMIKKFFYHMVFPRPVQALFILNMVVGMIFLVFLYKTPYYPFPVMVIAASVILPLVLLARLKLDQRIIRSRYQVFKIRFPHRCRTTVNFQLQTVTIERENTFGSTDEISGTNQKIYVLDFSDIITWFEDTAYYYLVFKGYVVTSIGKEKFIQGEPKRCKEMMKHFPRKKRIRAIIIFALLLIWLVCLGRICFLITNILFFNNALI